MRSSLIVAFLVVLTACAGSTEPLPSDTGVTVQVSRGPINPVETQDQQPNTAPVAGARVIARPHDGGEAQEGTTDAHGVARILLAPGSYTITVSECPGAMSLPKEDASIAVSAGAFATTALVCDTGIR